MTKDDSGTEDVQAAARREQALKRQSEKGAQAGVTAESRSAAGVTATSGRNAERAAEAAHAWWAAESRR